MATLILELGRTGDLIGWLAHERAGQPWRPGDAVPAQTRVVALAPAELVTWHRPRVPARRSAELRQAVPFALEEHLAEPVEALHFALGDRSDDQIDVAVTARARMHDWLQRLTEAGLSPDSVHADAQLLPRAEGVIHLVRVGERILLASTDLVAALPAADWAQWQAYLPSQPRHWLGSDGRFHDTDSPPSLDRTQWLRHAATRLIANPAPDLLQGEFTAQRQAANWQRHLRWAAVLAGLAVVLLVAEAAVGVISERQRQQALRAEIASVFRQTLPDQRMTADPAAQFASELARQRGGRGEGPFALLSAAAPLITQGSRYQLQALDFRQGVLELEIETADVAGLDGLREALASSGLAVEVTGVNPHSSGVRGRLRLRGAGA